MDFTSQEFLKREFIYHVSDTLVILGAGEEMVNALRDVQEKPLTKDIIKLIKNFNNDRWEELKKRFDLLNKITVSRSDKDTDIG